MGKTRSCSVCGTEVSLFRVKIHEGVCTGVYPHKKTLYFEIDSEGKRICPECGGRFNKYGIATHWRLEHRGDPKYRKGGGWNRGMGKYPKKPTGSNGGIRKGAGRGKSGWYGGFWCDSSWELAWVIYAVDNSIQFTRNTVGYEYQYDGKVFKFYPDFLLDSGGLVEVKGYLDRRNIAKIATVEGLIVVGKEEIKPYLEYAIGKYGRDFISSAYQNPPEYRCCDCGTAVTKNAPRCAICARRMNMKTKIPWPSDEELLVMVGGGNRNKVAKSLGVSFTAVVKHLKSRGLVAPM